MMSKQSLYRRIFADACEYLLSFDVVDRELLDKHLDNWKERKPKSIQNLLFAMLGSVSNKQGMPNTIGDIGKIRPYLEGFDPVKIVEKYGSDWRKLFKAIEGRYKPPGRMVIDNPKSYWVIFCKSVISVSHFLSQFSGIEDFDKFVSQFYLNEYTRLALPLLLEKEVFGLGFALACDFLKENGYPKFVKPDVHIKDIFRGTGISKHESDYDIFKDVVRFSEDIGELPYRVDKLFWLVGSGDFYLDNIRINTNGGREFVEEVRARFGDKL